LHSKKYIALKEMFVAIFTSQETRCSQLSQDLNKQKEEVNSVGIKLKWTQNKLRTESEAYKVCG